MAAKANLPPFPADTNKENDNYKLKASGTYALSTEYDEEQAARQKGRKRLRYIAAICCCLVLVGAGVGLGLGLGLKGNKKSHDKREAPAPTPQAANASEPTTTDLKFLPDVKSEAKAILQNTTTDEAKAALQLLDDADKITPELIIKFLDYFDARANLTQRGVNVEYFKLQAYSVARWLRSRPELAGVLQLLRNFANDPKLDPVELAKGIDQVIGGLKVKDFQQFISKKADKDDEFDESQLKDMITLTPEEEAMDDAIDPTTGNPVNATGRRLAAVSAASVFMDPLNQILFKSNPRSYINNPKAAGFKWFPKIRIPVVFHVLTYVDSRGYIYPYNANAQRSRPGQNIVNVLNKAYRPTGISFELRQWRSDPKRYKYLKIGSLQAWQACAGDQEACTCSLANLYNVSPARVINVWVVGSTQLQYSQTDAIAFSTIIPGVLDSCKDVMRWRVPAIKSQHLWMSYDMVDPDASNSPLAFEDGAMTLAHELGHYNGMLHTHQGDCQDLDRLSDTPANKVIQDQPFNDALTNWCIKSWGKPVAMSRALKKKLSGYDSCKQKRFIDNISNFMSYVHSACYRLFTPGQIKLMQKVIRDHHKYYYAVGGAKPKRPAPRKKTG